MTNFPVRAGVDGEWRVLDVDQLPDDALEAFAARLSPEKARAWLVSLARWIRENVKESPRDGADAAGRLLFAVEDEAVPGDELPPELEREAREREVLALLRVQVQLLKDILERLDILAYPGNYGR